MCTNLEKTLICFDLPLINNSIRDLGFTMCLSSSSNVHIKIACCKALKSIKILKSYFLQIYILFTYLKALYCTLARRQYLITVQFSEIHVLLTPVGIWKEFNVNFANVQFLYLKLIIHRTTMYLSFKNAF